MYMTAPKLFISYSWSNVQHEELVMQIATELVESGVDVILDKWHLREGHDSNEFMEQMVTDNNITKVAIISDKIYAEKADGRSGGVGTETQIISKRVYDGEDKDKFVAILTERDESGKPYLPTYYSSKIYIDMSNSSTYVENFEKLVRWIYDKPLNIRPELGNKPSFLEDTNLSLGTSASFKRALDAIKNSKPSAEGFLNEYLNSFHVNLERFRIKNDPTQGYANIFKNIDDFTPARNEYIQIINAITQFNPSPSFIYKINRFFESLIPYMFVTEEMNSYSDTSFDNFKFIINEIFLYTLAILIKEEKFSLTNLILSELFIVPINATGIRNSTSNYTIFKQHLKSFEIRNQDLKLNRISLHADLLKERSSGTGVDFKYLMQADFVAFLRNDLFTPPNNYGGQYWWPVTLVYSSYHSSAFEVFLRSRSVEYFEKAKVILNIKSKKELESLISQYRSGDRRIPTFDHSQISPEQLMNYDSLATLE